MIQITRKIPVLSINSIEDCDLFIHITDFSMTGGFRMVSPETQEYYDIQDAIVAKQAQVNGSTGQTRLNFLAQLDQLKQLADSMLIKDEGECIVRMNYTAVNAQGVEIPFSVNGLQNNIVFYVSDLASYTVAPQENDYQTLREKAKLFVLDYHKNIGFLGLLDTEYLIP